MSYINVTTEVDVDIDMDEILASMSDSEKAELIKDIDLEELRKTARAQLTPRQVVYALRKFDVDLRGVRDQILEHFPVKPKDDLADSMAYGVGGTLFAQYNELRAEFAKAIVFLKEGKAAFTPNTTNSHVDVFLERHKGQQ